jgi:serine/threonine-protein kinase
VHRDLKPSNLMINPHGQIKLTDFGIAKDLDATNLTATGRTLGTAAYMAPEQIRGTPPVSHKTDLYSLGVVLYQMLTGRIPFEGATAVVLMHCHLNEPPPRPSVKAGAIPKALDELVVKLMAKAPQDRPWDAEAVAFVLTELRDRAAKGEPVSIARPVPGVNGGAPAGRGETATGKKARKATRTLRTFEFGGTVPGRRRLETVGLVVALVAVVGAIAYVVYPPGEAYLYRHAKELMASTSRADWINARDEYIEPLDRRFPNHAHRDETRSWLDQLLLGDSERRAALLDSAVRTPLNQPNTMFEHQYVLASKQAAELTEKKDDVGTLHAWADFARVLKPEDKDERPWFLLGQKRIADLETAMQSREKFVRGKIEEAQADFNRGRFDKAAEAKSYVLKEYGAYTSLETVFPPDWKPGAEKEKEPKDAKKDQADGKAAEAKS